MGSEMVAGGDNVRASLPDVVGQTIGEMVAGGIAGRSGSGDKPFAKEKVISASAGDKARDIAARANASSDEAMWIDAQYDPVAGALMGSIRTDNGDPDPDSNYSEIVEFTDKRAEDALYAEYITGMPATATMGSIGEEFRTLVVREPWDSILDEYGLVAAGMLRDDLFQSTDDVLNFLYERDRDAIASGEPWQGDRVNKLVDPLRIDIGPGNINFGTAMYMVELYNANPTYQSDPLNLRRYADRPTALYRDLMNQDSPTSVYITALKLDHWESFILNPPAGNPERQMLRDTYVNSTGAARDALLNTGYRTSYNGVVRNIARTQTVAPILRQNWPNYFTDPNSAYHAQAQVLDDVR